MRHAQYRINIFKNDQQDELVTTRSLDEAIHEVRRVLSRGGWLMASRRLPRRKRRAAK